MREGGEGTGDCDISIGSPVSGSEPQLSSLPISIEEAVFKEGTASFLGLRRLFDLLVTLSEEEEEEVDAAEGCVVEGSVVCEMLGVGSACAEVEVTPVLLKLE